MDAKIPLTPADMARRRWQGVSETKKRQIMKKAALAGDIDPTRLVKCKVCKKKIERRKAVVIDARRSKDVTYRRYACAVCAKESTKASS